MMSAMIVASVARLNLGWLALGYLGSIAAIVLYARRVISRGRDLGKDIPDADKPWR